MSDRPREEDRRARLAWGLLSCGAACALLLIVAWRWHEHRLTHAEQRLRLEMQVRDLGSHIEGSLFGVNRILRMVSTAEHVDSAALRLLSDASTDIDALDVLDASGRPVASSGAATGGSELAGQPCFQQARADPDPDFLYTCAPYRNRSGAWSVEWFRLRVDEHGALAGVVAASLDLNSLSATLPSALYAEDMRAFMLQRDGVVIASGRNDKAGTGASLARPPDDLVSRFRGLGTANAVIDDLGTRSGDRRMVAVHTLNLRGLRMSDAPLLTLSRSAAAVYHDWTLTTWLAGGAWVFATGAGAAALRRVQRRRHERAHAAVALQRQRLADLERIELIVGGADLSLWVWHPDAQHLEVDARWCEMIGAPADDLAAAARTWRARLHPDDRLMIRDVVQPRIALGNPIEFEYRLRHDDGHWVWLLTRGKVVERDADGRPLRLAGTHIDITERKRVEQALRASEESLSTTLQSIGDAVIATDAQGRILRMNAEAERLTGWSPREALGHASEEVFRIVDGATRAVLASPVQAVLATGTSAAPGSDMVLLTRGATERPIAQRAAPIRTAAGAVNGVVLVFRDISELRRLEEHLRESQKMDSIGTLAGGIAHDFNNVLGAVVGNAELALDRLAPGHAARAFLEQVSRSSQRARGLVQQILTFSRRQPLQLVSLPLRPLIEETLEILRSTLPASLHLSTTLGDVPLHVNADANQLQQVLMNLCTNAWHALEAGRGHIGVGLEPVRLAGPDDPRVRGLAAGSYAHLWVSDDGSGMDEATRLRIFEPFFTTKEVGLGTGLGLSVVHGIVRTHLGAVTLDTTPGAGSTFHVYLPAQPGPTVDTTEPDLARPSRRGRGQHVLYVDDDDVMALMVVQLLENAGYRVTSRPDGKAALELLRACPWACDVVVTDFNMPGCSGLDLARELAALRPDLPVVLSSGYLSDDLRTDARQAGIRHVLRKENTYEELAGLVDLALGSRELARLRLPTRRPET